MPWRALPALPPRAYALALPVRVTASTRSLPVALSVLSFAAVAGALVIGVKRGEAAADAVPGWEVLETRDAPLV